MTSGETNVAGGCVFIYIDNYNYNEIERGPARVCSSLDDELEIGDNICNTTSADWILS